MRLRVTINGGPINVHHQHGLTANPFPALPKMEFATANCMLRALDSDPIESVDDVRRILKGCDKEFIDLCCKLFEPGKRISFTVEWPGEL